MTPAELDEIEQAGREYARTSRKAQGLPPHVTDPQTLERIAAIFRSSERERQAS